MVIERAAAVGRWGALLFFGLLAGSCETHSAGSTGDNGAAGGSSSASSGGASSGASQSGEATGATGHTGGTGSAGGEASGSAESGAGEAGGNPGTADAGDAGDLDARTAMLLALADGHAKPIADAHVHIYQPSRPGGVPWPDPSNPILYQDYLPSKYESDTAGLGILLTNVVEASSIDQDTFWVLNQIKGDSAFFNYAAELDPTSVDFVQNLNTYTVDSTTCPTCGDTVSGLRAYVWNGPVDADDPVQSMNLTELQQRGMTLDIISQGQMNPTAQVAALAAKFPSLRIIIDHLAGARLPADSTDPNWHSDMALLASHPNIYMKLSS